MKISTYVNGVLFHRTNEIYQLGMLKPSRYCDFAINIIKEKLLRAENNLANCQDYFTTEKLNIKIKKYNVILSNLSTVSNKETKAVIDYFEKSPMDNSIKDKLIKQY